MAEVGVTHRCGGTLYTTYSDIEEKAVAQANLLLGMETYEEQTAHLLPDAHFCMGLSPVGLALTFSDVKGFHPSIISADAGCGVSVYRIPNVTEEMLFELSKNMKDVLDFGKKMYIQEALDALECYELIDNDKEKKMLFERSFCTLGGGNHFFEIGEHLDEISGVREHYIVIHSGSRNIGGLLLKRGNDLAEENAKRVYSNAVSDVVREYSTAEDKSVISDIISSLERPDGTIMRGVVLDIYKEMEIFAQKYASLNRDAIAKSASIILFGEDKTEKLVDKPHNYVDWDLRVLHKGSMGVSVGELIAIPLNMRDGTIVGRASGNVAEWGYNLPHGAGRSKSRGEAVLDISIDEYKEQTKGIISHTINENTIDEAPSAYKDSKSISEVITAKLFDSFVIKPLMSFKESEPKWHKR